MLGGGGKWVMGMGCFNVVGLDDFLIPALHGRVIQLQQADDGASHD